MEPTSPYDRVVPVTEMHGSMVAASLAVLRRDLRESQYFQLVDPRYAEAIRVIEPLSWVPVELVIAHHRVMGELYPDPIDQIRNGRENAERTINTWAQTVLRAARAAGAADPTVLLRRIVKATDRSARGGGAVAAYQTGVKDARVEFVGFPTLAFAYARNGLAGMFEGLLGLAARRVFVRQDRPFAQGKVPGAIAYDVSWI